MKTKTDYKDTAGLILLSLNDIDKLTKMLNEAHSHEWLTYYQSWIGAILMEGPLKNEIKTELMIHANQELNHALLIKSRMIELGINLINNLSETSKTPRCQIPVNQYIESILHKNLENEISAIQLYKEIADLTNGKDHTTYKLAESILNEELEHEQSITNWLAAIQKMKLQLKTSTNNKHFAVV